MQKALLIHKNQETAAYFSNKALGLKIETLDNMEDFCLKKHLPKYDFILLATEIGNTYTDQIIQKIKSAHAENIAIVCLGSGCTNQRRVELFELGIDEYIPKDVDVREAYFRVSNLKKSKPSLNLMFGNLTLDPIKDEVFIDRQKLDLTQIEYKILHHLVSSKKECSSSEIISSVWKKREVDIKTFNTHFSNLNKKLSEWNFRLHRVRNKYIKIIGDSGSLKSSLHL